MEKRRQKTIFERWQEDVENGSQFKIIGEEKAAPLSEEEKDEDK